MPTMSVIGPPIEAVEPPAITPACPRVTNEESCPGTMQRGASVKTMRVGLQDNWEQLRCNHCGLHRWYRVFTAFALLPEDLEGI